LLKFFLANREKIKHLCGVMSNQANTFAAGQNLSARSACDSDCVFTATVIKRTAARVTLDLGCGEIKTVKVFKREDGSEYCFPFGQFSMAPTMHAPAPATVPQTPAPTPTQAAAPVAPAALVDEAKAALEVMFAAGFTRQMLLAMSPEAIMREFNAINRRNAFSIVA
jgi:hypothetical protein